MLPSNEKPSVLPRSRREEMMQKLSQQEKEEINQNRYHFYIPMVM
jgi:hypothetical protein